MENVANFPRELGVRYSKDYELQHRCIMLAACYILLAAGYNSVTNY